MSALEQCGQLFREIALSESMLPLGSELIHCLAKGIEYEDRTSTFVLVSWRPLLAEGLAGKMLLTVFFDIQGPLFVEFLEHRGTITSDVYCETLQSLRRSSKNKRQEMLMESVVLLHDNARPHVSSVTHTK